MLHTVHAVQHGGIKTEEDLLVCHKGVHLSNPDPVVFLLLVFIVSCQCFLSVVIMCINTPLFLPFPSVLHPLVCPPQTVQIQIYTQCCSPLPVLLLLSLCATPSRSLLFFFLSVFLYSSHSLHASMAGLQRATTHARGARCCGDLDRQRSHPDQCEAAGNAPGFCKVPAAEHQTPRRCCAPHLVSSLFKPNQRKIQASYLYNFVFCTT